MNILSHDQSQNYHNPAFNRGHLVFTSLIQVEKKILFLDSHLDRLLKGAEFLFPELGWAESREKVRAAALAEFDRQEDLYLRMSIAGDTLWFEKKKRPLTDHQIKVALAEKKLSPGLKPAFLKLSHYVEADLELKRASEKKADDVLFLDTDGFVCEGTTSNIFIVSDDGKLKTPPVSSMVLQGITRENFIAFWQRKGRSVSIEPLRLTDLEKAKEIWFTNAVKGLRFVSQFQDKVFTPAGTVYEEAVMIFGRYGERDE